LPAPLQPLLRARQGLWQGRSIEVRIEPLGTAGADGHRLAARSRIGHGLTRREETIARAYAAGDSYKEIARQFGLSPATVRGYLRDCYLKLGVSNKAALGGVLQRGG
jgi:DNA-binding CsgD family transcriptional regulator